MTKTWAEKIKNPHFHIRFPNNKKIPLTDEEIKKEHPEMFIPAEKWDKKSN